jgi:alanine racemase
MQAPRVHVNLDILADNIHGLRRELRPETEIMFVVKSDAYGHGLRPVVRRAAAEGVRWFAVAFFHEALLARTAAPDADILVLGPLDATDVPQAIAQRITPTVVDADHARRLGEAAQKTGATLPFHVKIDTGMGRLGLVEGADPRELEQILTQTGLRATGICSHLAAVDLKRPWLQEKQQQRFVQAVTAAERIVGRRLMRHLCSSRAIQYYPDWDYDAVRPGILLYGYGCTDPKMRVRTRPFLQWSGSVMQVKSMPEGSPIGYYGSYHTTRCTRIGIVGGGYADGYLRAMSNRGEVLVNGERKPVVGRISMNWISVDLGPDSVCQPGDDVLFLGENGSEAIWADTLARRAGTIAYEILTAIHPLIPRQYQGDVPSPATNNLP